VHDLVIRRGAIFDGSGSDPFEADVAVDGDRISVIASAIPRSGRIEVDARGVAVAPGFINMLSWAAEPLLVDGRSQSDLRQGVTLEVFGEGDSLGPLNREMRESMLAAQGPFRYDITWTTLAEALDHLVERGVSCNVASFIGATTVRTLELGHADRSPSKAELQRMRGAVRSAMAEGALGVGSSLIYAPAHFAQTSELVALASESAEAGGLYISHVRSEGDALLEGVDEFLAIMRSARSRAEIYHLKAAGAANWDVFPEVIERIGSARASGAQVTADMYPYSAGAAGLDGAMPPWVQEGGPERWVARLQDPGIRQQVASAMRAPGDGWENLLYLSGGAEHVRVVGFRTEPLRRFTGETLASVARSLGCTPEDAAMDLVVADGSRVDAIYHNQSEANVRIAARMPWVSFGSDEGSYAAEGPFLSKMPHPRGYGTFARVLGRFVRDEGLFPLAEGIRRMTSLPASTLRIADRGRLAVGHHADIVVFDPTTIIDHATYERPHRYASGVQHVFVNGVHSIADGEHTGVLSGQVVRGPSARGDSRGGPDSDRAGGRR
jgi:N-acyl-D-amino-acid deacylase